MKMLKAILISASLLALLLSPNGLAPVPAVSASPSDPTNGAAALIDLLPESTVLGVEIRDLAERWPEIRAVPAISRFLDRLMTDRSLEPDDLPRLAGNAAIVALVPAGDARSLIPVALLRPPHPEQAEEILSRSAPLEVLRGRGALWVGPPNVSDRLERIAAGDGTSARRSLVMDEAYRRLPDRGLIRGWVNPGALRTLLSRHVEGVRPLLVEIVRSFVTAELDTIRFIGFRRELNADGVITDGVIGIDASALPGEVVQALNATPESELLLPSPLPPGTLLASSFRTEAEACLGWLRYVAASDPRGPLRNLDFWMDEFRERTRLDLERDLFGALGEQGSFLLLEGDTSEIVQAVAILETKDPGRLEETLLDLRAWLMEQIQGRTLGLVLPRIRDASLNGWTLHDLTFWTPLAQLPGPVFLVTDEHLVVGTGEPALRAGLNLLQSRDVWKRATGEDAGAVSRSRLEHVRLLGPAMARWIEARAGSWGPAHVRHLASAMTGLLAESHRISMDVWYEEDAVRIRGRIRFATE
jgi:hypothetical protein